MTDPFPPCQILAANLAPDASPTVFTWWLISLLECFDIDHTILTVPSTGIRINTRPPPKIHGPPSQKSLISATRQLQINIVRGRDFVGSEGNFSRRKALHYAPTFFFLSEQKTTTLHYRSIEFQRESPIDWVLSLKKVRDDGKYTSGRRW
ncbi:hypothetical protein CEXT_284531 [Caerostris extrusa]|uniref:LAGLIDADG homing endonuclease n=1 Tax=Caerostris extrusa TaxID=172846 RepID=A0AAV4NMG7_CAEEX|nr:hypothetical protein CEXT_284531 [Caerostris extrusa]